LLLALPLAAQPTRTWEQSRFSDFEKGTAKGVALRSDGKLTLGPRFQEVYDAPASYLWALARDSKGNLYAGGGPGARVFKIAPDGKKSQIFENEALEVHALAVDRQDNVYAATSPDSKVYKIDSAGRSTLFVDPQVKYVWAMAFNSQGELFLATGDKGEVLRVDANGRSQVFFKTDESHIRTLLVEPNGDLVLGTDPGGLVIRVPAAGGLGFVLYQSQKKEITALVRDEKGALYAAGVGARPRVTTPLPTPAPAAPQPGPSGIGGGPGAPGAQPAPPVPLATIIRTDISGGSEIFRIDPDGSQRRLWSANDPIVYALGFGAGGKLLAGTGNSGQIYQVDSEHLYTLLLKTPPAQVTAFLRDPSGKIYAATANVGKVYGLGPELEPEGSFESEVFDAAVFSRWGRLKWQGGVPAGAAVAVSVRSGNLGAPAQYWSPWSQAATTPDGALVSIPGARFAQWKAVFKGGPQSPLLDKVTLAYLPKNVAPTISEIEITPPNYKFPDPPSTSSSSSKSLTLPALGQRPSPRTPPTPPSTRTMNPAKGYLGVRWLARDENDDEMVFKVEIRGVNEQNWKLLKDNVEEEYLSWDATAFADGRYQIRVTASDSPSNPGLEALSYSAESEPFTIDNTPPEIAGITAAREASHLRVKFRATDAASRLDRAEYSVDGGEWKMMLPVTRLFDYRQLDFDFPTGDAGAGEHTVAVRVWDANDNLATAKAVVR
jgi:outer membrane protein assembly factor BamB